MRITVRQLKGLIREAIEEAHDDMTGYVVAPGDDRGQLHNKGGSSKKIASPSVQAKLERLAKKHRKFFYTDDPLNVLHDIADDVEGLPGTESMEGLFAHVDMVVNIAKKGMDDQTFQEVKDSVAEFKEERKREAAEDKADIDAGW